ncbi:GNAT family N-acetyltransferase [Tabrizicola sp.]|uniref:GNAT family N-acetyltransferase n=1 Tax=Tabrizicola sp. TaxID=2005166 RepID=UPI00286B12E5|nr:GNAT family N-acetyltransferase [Tabrizicola sp.]
MQTSAVLLRLGPEDAPLLWDADVFDGPVHQDWLAAFLAEPSHLIVVAVLDGRVAGFASGAVLHHPDKPPSLYIMELGVNEDARRQGIATTLVAAIRSDGRARGCQTAFVLAEPDNAAARGLYSQLAAKETPDVVMFDWDAPDTPTSDG